MTMMRAAFVLAALMIGLSLPTLATHAAERGTPEEAKALVAKAIAAFKEKGPAVFDEINAGGFRDRDLYVFVYATGDQGKVVAYGGPPVDPPILGRPTDDIKDADGLPLGNMLEEKATPEGVWVDYRWKHPQTSEVVDKSSWVVTSGDYIFGCGIHKISGQSTNVEQLLVGAAMLAANFVAAAERAGMSRDEINAVLRDIVAKSGIEEFWITDSKGHAYLTSTNVDFNFNPDPAVQPQASAFWPLLTGTKSIVVQEPMIREIDNRKFQYIAVTGVDKPRIVSIGRSAGN